MARLITAASEYLVDASGNFLISPDQQTVATAVESLQEIETGVVQANATPSAGVESLQEIETGSGTVVNYAVPTAALESLQEVEMGSAGVTSTATPFAVESLAEIGQGGVVFSPGWTALFVEFGLRQPEIEMSLRQPEIEFSMRQPSIEFSLLVQEED